MNIRILQSYLMYDFRQGLVARWKWYLSAILIFAIQWVTAYKNVMLLEVYGYPSALGTYADYVLFSLRGVAPIPVDGLNSRIDLPVQWICIFVGSLVCAIGYSDMESNNYAIQITVRSKNWEVLWISKCLWCALSAAVYFLIGYLTLAALCLLERCPLTLMATPEFADLFFSSEQYIAFQAIPVIGIIKLGFLLPISFALLLNLMQITLNMFFNLAQSFVICVAALVFSACDMSKFLIGSYAMVMRSNYIIRNGFDSSNGLIIYMFLILLFTIVGLKRIKSIDYLPDLKERS